MFMDPNSTSFSDFINDFKVDDETVVPNANQYSDVENGFKFAIPSPDLNLLDIPFNPPDPDPDPGIITPSSTMSAGLESLGASMSLSPDGSSFAPSTSWSPEGRASSPSDDSDSSDAVLKYISQMLMEEKMEEQPCMFYDPLALQATERSLYEVLGEQHPLHPSSLSQTQFSVNLNSVSGENDNSFSNSSSDFKSSSGVSSTNSGSSDFVNTQLIGDTRDYNPSFLKTPLPDDYRIQCNLQRSSLPFSVNPPESLTASGHVLLSSVNEFLAQNMFSDRESVLQFKKGMEEASKFLPTGNQLIIDLESYGFCTERKEDTSKVVVKVEKDERENSPEGSRGRKNRQREDVELEEGRNKKQSAIYVEEGELSDMFDKVLLLHTDQNGKPVACYYKDHIEALQTESSNSLQQNGQSNGSGGRSHAKKQRKKESGDLRTLLILCAQAVSSNDCRTANSLLEQIRQHSSPSGDGSQRLAHYFANGLEARLAGSGTRIKNFFTSSVPKKSAADMLKAYKVYLYACPFKKFAIFFANKMIMNVSEKATTLHIVDFGVQYGFQWPALIQQLSMRPRGPPKLRITGIELPQPGFRPAERIEETGRRLAKYCERFKVPFEFNAIASQKWETIQIEDLKINPNEVLAVNSLFRLKNLLDETVEVNCPRNAVLSLIRKLNPNIFVNAIVNGSYNAPFFVTRFREAIFHFSSLFDMFDTTIPREDPERLMLESEFYGREAMNVIACEGLERVERPETYKQWQVRSMRAGFKQLPLDQETVKKLGVKLKAYYHKDFVIDEDSNWMLQGWKGRIVYGSSCWVPA